MHLIRGQKNNKKIKNLLRFNKFLVSHLENENCTMHYNIYNGTDQNQGIYDRFCPDLCNNALLLLYAVGVPFTKTERERVINSINIQNKPLKLI